ncbi:NAD(P)/FAD-dependent oxidoreductase [Mesorhizobium xinjiangense]|uniref:NAD(P)/FAD-dependent oxidoreductase n=1 Tax=Mesorhizobium xinjiangense TaxID=2678685 RepID=UPI001F1C0935|nr:FAD-binding oxidoreductase [Mesorhizobium xinjiangense]
MPETGPETFDIAIIGAGIAGASLAGELGDAARMVLLERESQPGYHTTGRSAALFSETYGPPAIRALSRASAAFFDAPPTGFAAAPLLSPRGVLMVARGDQLGLIEETLADPTTKGRFRRLDARAAGEMVPILRTDYAAAALYEENARDIDVHALHHGYLRRFKSAGGRIETDCEVRAVERVGERWHISTSKGDVAADIVVNAAGAWADELGQMAGARTIGLAPKRRTAMMISPPDGVDPSAWPMLVDIAEAFYMKPDAGKLLASPADETPSPPCDAQPEELDVAICIDRIMTACDIDVRHIDNRWAGLRSFVADKTPVVGFDDGVPGFFWLAGQGGYGIQTAPALARLAAALVREQPVPRDIADEGVDAVDLSPARLTAV